MAFIIALIILFLAAPAGAQESQRILFNLQNLKVTYDTSASNLNAALPTIPSNLVSPVNFAGGNIYIKAVVKNKPTNMYVQNQLCMWANNFSKETCSNSLKSFTTNGTYYYKTDPPANWWSQGGFSWSEKFDFMDFIHEDEETDPYWYDACGGACYTGPLNLREHMPFNIDLEGIIVAQGAAFQRPAAWADCPAAVCGSGPAITTAPSVGPPVPGTCTKKNVGDADCDGTVSVTDYAVWRTEYKGGCTSTNLTAAACGDNKDNVGTIMDADFGGDNKVSLADYQVWRSNIQ